MTICNFCERNNKEAKVMIAGNDDVAICSSCVTECMNIIVNTFKTNEVINMDSGKNDKTENIKERGVEMEKLITIQKREKLNEVSAVDEKGNGGANHKYVVQRDRLIDKDTLLHEVTPLCNIAFQKGPRDVEGSVEGVIDTDLLEIVRHRLQSFQNGEFSTRENAIALTHIEEALMWLNRRVEDRIERNVLGTENK